MFKFYKWFLISATVLLFTACGGTGSTQLSQEEVQKEAIAYIANYAENGGEAPEVRHYEDAGITGVTADNLDQINATVVDLTATDVDTPEKLHALAEQLGIELPDDTTPPVITLNGANPITILKGEPYTEPGATATDDRNGNVPVEITGTVDTNTVGSYIITYKAKDLSDNEAVVTRTVNVILASTPDTTPPVITLNGTDPMSVIQGNTYTEPGATAIDDRDGNRSVEITGTVDTNTVGSYTITYKAKDLSDNEAVVTRTVNVTMPDDTIKPIITLLGDATVSLTVGDEYTDAGATASDNVDGDITGNIQITSTVNTATAGTYSVKYNVSDAAGNAADEVIRTVTVNEAADTVKPVITLLGDATVNLTVGDEYTDAGATASDNVDGDITGNIQITSTVNTATAGTYSVKYNVSDAAGNAADEVIRTVTVNEESSGSLTWNFFSSVAQGTQFDAQAGPNNKIHLISSKYYQLNLSGDVVVNEDQGDALQLLTRFPPAIAVCSDGSVHIVTRHDGDKNTGYDIRYRRRNTDNTWDRSYLVGSRVARNYVVGIACANANNIIVSSTEEKDDVYGDINLWKAESSSATSLGYISNMWRSDVDNRMRGNNDKIHLVAGIHSSSLSKIYYSYAETGADIKDQINNNKKAHEAGSARRSFPDIALDGQDNAHFVYGTQYEVYYNKYNSSGNKVFSSDKKLFSNLGDWHLNMGLSAIGVSEDGNTIVAVALRTNGSDTAADSDILWTYSTDSGSSWNGPYDTGKNSDAGEGRRRPRLIEIDNTFVLLFGDTEHSGISMGVLTID